MKKLLILVIFFGFTIEICFSQTTFDRLKKYWYYRQRFLNAFVLKGDATYPVYVAAVDNIVSDSKFHNYLTGFPTYTDAAVGIYKAKNSIILKPGFKVEPGAYFHGIIQDISCNDIWLSWKPTNPSSNSSASEKDSIISIPKDKDILNICPNPSDGNMTVSYNLIKDHTGTFYIYNTLGEELLTYPLKRGINTFNITGEIFSKGIYTYRAFAGNKQIASDKIVVIK